MEMVRCQRGLGVPLASAEAAAGAVYAPTVRTRSPAPAFRNWSRLEQQVAAMLDARPVLIPCRTDTRHGICQHLPEEFSAETLRVTPECLRPSPRLGSRATTRGAMKMEGGAQPPGMEHGVAIFRDGRLVLGRGLRDGVIAPVGPNDQQSCDQMEPLRSGSGRWSHTDTRVADQSRTTAHQRARNPRG
jgi:hypothetical protein